MDGYGLGRICLCLFLGAFAWVQGLGASPEVDLSFCPPSLRLQHKRVFLDDLASRLPLRPAGLEPSIGPEAWANPEAPALDLDPETAAYAVAVLLSESEVPAALETAARYSLDLGLQPRLVEGLLAQAVLSRNPQALEDLLNLLGQPDPTELALWCIQADFPQGLRLLVDSSFDTYLCLKEAVALSNAEAVDLLLPLAPANALGPGARAQILEACLQRSRPQNEYIYGLLLLAGYDEGLRYVNQALENALLSLDYSPSLEPSLRRRLGDFLIGHGADVNAYDPFYGPYLHWFSRLQGFKVEEKKEMQRYLLARGAKSRERWEGLYYWEIPLSSKLRINEKGVRLRASPSLKAAILETLEAGTRGELVEMGETELSLDGYTGLWYKIRLASKKEGWVYGKYLDFID